MVKSECSANGTPARSSDPRRTIWAPCSGPELFSERVAGIESRRAARYRKQVAAERERVDALLRKLRLDGMSIRCGDDWQKPLVHFFARRARRMRR